MSKQLTPPSSKPASPKRPGPAERAALARQQARRRLVTWGAVAVVGVGALLFGISSSGGGGSGGAPGRSGPRFDVGAPGPGAEAPNFRLESTAGAPYDLAAARGRTVLVYFQEGLMCQPCWDQIRDIEENMEQFKALGIDEMVSITTDPLRLVRQKVADEKLTSPVLSDPDVSLGKSYNANRYGMMGLDRYGHSFVVVGPDGKIQWRADYGGAPDHTMYVKVPALLEDLRSGLKAG